MTVENEDQYTAFEDTMAATMGAVSPEEAGKMSDVFASLIGSRADVGRRLDKARLTKVEPAFKGTFFGMKDDGKDKEGAYHRSSDHASELGRPDASEKSDSCMALLTTMSKEIKSLGVSIQGVSLSLSNSAKLQEQRQVELIAAHNAESTYQQRTAHEIAVLRKELTELRKLLATERASETVEGPVLALSPGIHRADPPPHPSTITTDNHRDGQADDDDDLYLDASGVEPVVSINWEF